MLRSALIPLLAAVLTWCCSPALAEEPLRVVNERYSFAFTAQSDCRVTYEADGVGLKALYLPAGAARPSYGALVYGSPSMFLSPEDAKAVGLPEDQDLLDAATVTDPRQWTEIFEKIMLSRGHARGGEAKISTPTGEISIPYFKWQQTVGGTTHHALMYVVKHGNNFVYVQVESSRELGAEHEAWLTTHLELLPITAATEAPDTSG